jgi:hypothetical protein
MTQSFAPRQMLSHSNPLALENSTVPTLPQCRQSHISFEPTTRSFITIRSWGQNRTTIIITDDIAAIKEQVFVHVMRNSSLVEQDFQLDLAGAGDEFSGCFVQSGFV